MTGHFLRLFELLPPVGLRMFSAGGRFAANRIAGFEGASGLRAVLRVAFSLSSLGSEIENYRPPTFCMEGESK